MPVTMELDDAGGWVSWDDYLTLLVANDELREQLEPASASVEATR